MGDSAGSLYNEQECNYLGSGDVVTMDALSTTGLASDGHQSGSRSSDRQPTALVRRERSAPPPSSPSSDGGHSSDNDEVATPWKPKSAKTVEAGHQMEPTSVRRHASTSTGVKLGTYDGSTCLETFLVNIRSFASYFEWIEKDGLFDIRASLCRAGGSDTLGPWSRCYVG